MARSAAPTSEETISLTLQAMAVCREGERLLERLGDHSREFAPLMDQARGDSESGQSALLPRHHGCFDTLRAASQVTTAAALAGCLEVFDGREIRVRTAGDDAWLVRRLK